MSDLRAGSPISRRPPTTNAATSPAGECAAIFASGKLAKATNMATTNGFRPTRSARCAAGSEHRMTVAVWTPIKPPNAGALMRTTFTA